MSNASSSLAHSSDVTTWLEQLREDDSQVRQSAERKLYERFANLLKPGLRQLLSQRIRQRLDASDIYQELMDSFFCRWQAGIFDLPDRQAVKALLLDIGSRPTRPAACFTRRCRRAKSRCSC